MTTRARNISGAARDKVTIYLLAPGGKAIAQQWLVQTWDTAL